MDEHTNNQDTQKKNGVHLPVTWGDIDSIPTVYVNQLLVSHSDEAFYLVFGELLRPMLLGVPGEQIPEHVEIRPRVKIAVHPEVMIKFAEAINANISNYLSKADEKDDE